MFWKVAGFSQPSPVEQILDKDEYTLEELLDEDDIIQECKSLNGRLVAFLRERSSVEQLIRYLVEPQDSDDPKRTYKYPFTACEVLCCELEAVFNTLLEDAALMQLLFSLLDRPAPLDCKTAGYFGRVVGNLLLRKGAEMLDYMQKEGTPLLTKLVKHVDTTSIADIIKRMVGADDQSSLMGSPSAAMSPWLASTPLLELLLERLNASNSPEAQANSADILSSTANSQPSPLAAKLAEPVAVTALVEHALAPGRQVLVPALDVCIALVEPRRPALAGDALAAMSEPASMEAAEAARKDAVVALVQHVPRLVELLNQEQSSLVPQETPYGRLNPPLGRHRLKVVELLAALVRSGAPEAEQAVIQTSALQHGMRLFAAFPFNNLLHHSVAAMLQSCVASETLSTYLIEECGVLDWIVGLPTTVVPPPVPGDEAHAASKAPLRAGYLGHVTQIAGHLAAAGPTGSAGSSGDDGGEGDGDGAGRLSKYTRVHERWCQYVEDVLQPRQVLTILNSCVPTLLSTAAASVTIAQELENTNAWACGRPVTQPIAGLDSDADDFANDMDLDQIAGLQQPLFHRYSTNEQEEDAEEEEDGDELGGLASRAIGTFDFTAGGALAEAMSRMDLGDREGEDDDSGEGLGFASPTPVPSHTSMDDDDVLLGADEDEGCSPDSRPRLGSPGPTAPLSPLVLGALAGPDGDEVGARLAAGAGVGAQGEAGGGGVGGQAAHIGAGQGSGEVSDAMQQRRQQQQHQGFAT